MFEQPHVRHQQWVVARITKLILRVPSRESHKIKGVACFFGHCSHEHTQNWGNVAITLHALVPAPNHDFQASFFLSECLLLLGPVPIQDGSCSVSLPTYTQPPRFDSWCTAAGCLSSGADASRENGRLLIPQKKV